MIANAQQAYVLRKNVLLRFKLLSGCSGNGSGMALLFNSNVKEVLMNKQDLVSKVADSADISKQKAASAVDAVIDAIKGSLKTGEDVRLVGFGTFSVSNRAATTGRNPRTGEPIQIPASKQPKFKAGKELKEAVNGKK